jgi:hypothetical protein
VSATERVVTLWVLARRGGRRELGRSAYFSILGDFSAC